jgi:hypothetical protein
LSQNEASAIRSPSLKTSLGVAGVSFMPPQRQDFEFYYGAEGESWRDRDPFVPLNAQSIVVKLGSKKPLVVIREPPKPFTLPGPVDPKNQPKIDIPKDHIPEFDPNRFAIPRVLGMLKLGDERVGTIRMGDATVQVREGETIKGWKLVRLDSQHATLRSSLGENIEVPVGLSLGEENSLAPEVPASSGAKPVAASTSKTSPKTTAGGPAGKTPGKTDGKTPPGALDPGKKGVGAGGLTGGVASDARIQAVVKKIVAENPGLLKEKSFTMDRGLQLVAPYPDVMQAYLKNPGHVIAVVQATINAMKR